MRRAVLVELTRLRWRRSVLLLVLAALVVPLLIAASLVWSTRPVSEADRAAAQEQVQREIDQPQTQRMLSQCERRPRSFGADRGIDTSDPAAVRAACEDMTLPQVDWYLDRPPMRVGWVYDQGTGAAVVSIVTVLLLLLGASFVGHDWSTASMSNQVLFEPRRLRLWSAKAGAVALLSAAVATVALLAFWGVVYLAQEVQGNDTRPATAGLVWGLSWHGVVLAAAAAVGGYALTMLLRSTVVTIGLLFVVAVALPILVAVVGSGERLLPQYTVDAWLTGSVAIPQWDEPGCESAAYDRSDPAWEQCNIVVDRTDAVLVLGGLLVLTSGASAASFRRRDIA